VATIPEVLTLDMIMHTQQAMLNGVQTTGYNRGVPRYNSQLTDENDA